MNKAANLLTEFLLKHNIINKEEKDIYNYGFISGIELLFCLIINLLIAMIRNYWVELAIVLAVFIPLRSYVGGIHMKSYFSCLICTTCVINIIIDVSKMVQIQFLHVIFSFLICVTLIAINGCQSDINSRYEVLYYRKQSYMSLLVCALFWLFFSFIGKEEFANIILITVYVVAGSNVSEALTKFKLYFRK